RTGRGARSRVRDRTCRRRLSQRPCMTSLIDGLGSLFSPTHLLAIVALGLLAGQHAKRTPGVALAVFAIGLAVGSVAIAAAMRETPAALALLAIAAIAGIIVV